MSRDESGRGPLLEALHRASRQLTNQNGIYTDAVAARLGLNRTDLDCLSIVHLAGSATAGELAEVTGLTTGAMTGVIDRLVQAGYVRRDADPDDRRRVIVRAVPDRGRAVGELFEPMQQAIEGLYTRYSDEELAVLLDVNERLLPIMQEETARLRRPEADAAAATVHTSPLGDLAGARLEFSRGAAHVLVRAGGPMNDLYRAEVDRHGPAVSAQEGVVTVSYKRTGFRWGKAGQTAIELNPAIPWTVSVRGGATRLRADLAELLLRELELSGGLSHAEVTLPVPTTTVAISLTGGVHDLTIHRPAGAALRVRIRGGVSNLRLDAQRFGAVGGTMSWQTPDYDGATGRYDFRLTGGASTISLDEQT
jgi:DNA-binding MarR family transcriptional regulator